MTLNQIIYFEKVAEIGNMGKAAELLHIAQPSLSVAIAALEKELNIALFDRYGRRLSLSTEGRQFLIHAKKILADVQDARLHMQSLASDCETHIHIGCIAPVLYDYLPRKIHDFLLLRENRNLKVDFETDNTSILIPKLREGYFDFLICSESPDKDLFQNVLFIENYVLLCPPGAPIPKSWDSLLSSDLIGFHIKAAAHHEIHSMLAERGIQPNYLYRAPDEESIASLVSHGFGYGIVPHVESINSYNVHITALPNPNSGMVRKICLTQLANKPPRGASLRFMHYIMSQMSN